MISPNPAKNLTSFKDIAICLSANGLPPLKTFSERAEPQHAKINFANTQEA